MSQRTLYVCRKVINGDDLVSWAKDNGFATCLPPEEYHVTLAFSKSPVDWTKFTRQRFTYRNNIAGRTFAKFGELKNCVVMKIQAPYFQKRWQDFIDGGCSWDWPAYEPHITITYYGAAMDISNLTPYTGELVFGHEEFKEIDLQWQNKIKEI